jgi:hypothetical protein
VTIKPPTSRGFPHGLLTCAARLRAIRLHASLSEFPEHRLLTCAARLRVIR